MRYYRAEIHLGGDRNHVVARTNMPAPELAVLMSIHGSVAVNRVEEMRSDKTPHAVIKDQLTATYGRVRIGDGEDRRPVLRAVFPTWPSVDLPLDARTAGVPEVQMKGSAPDDKAAEAAMRAKILEDLEAEKERREAEQEAEFARQQEQERADEEALKPDNRSELELLRDEAAAAGVDEKDIKAAGQSKKKLGSLIEGKKAETNDSEGSSESQEFLS